KKTRRGKRGQVRDDWATAGIGKSKRRRERSQLSRGWSRSGDSKLRGSVAVDQQVERWRDFAHAANRHGLYFIVREVTAIGDNGAVLVAETHKPRAFTRASIRIDNEQHVITRRRDISVIDHLHCERIGAGSYKVQRHVALFGVRMVRTRARTHQRDRIDR